MDQASAGHVEPAADAATAVADGGAASGTAAGAADISDAADVAAGPAPELSLWEKLTKDSSTEVAQAETPVEETPTGESQAAVEESKPSLPKPERKARKLADLAEREAKAAAKEAELAKYQADVDEYRKTLEQLKTDPLAALEKAGLTYEQLTLEALKGKKGPSPEIEALKADFKKELDGIKQAEIDRQVAQAKASLKSHIEAAGDKYELTLARGDVDRVWETMLQITQQSGGKHIPTFDEAAEFWESQLEAEAEKFMNTKKIQAKITKPAAEKIEIADKQQVAPRPAAKPVLSNRVGAPAAPVSAPKPKTKADAFSMFKQLVDKAYRGEVINK